LSRCRFGNKSRKFPEHLLKQKHCTLTPHVKLLISPLHFFYSRVLRCCEPGVLQCSVTPPQNAGKHRNRFAEHVTGLGRRKCITRSVRGNRKRMNWKESEMRGVILAAVLAATAISGARAQDAAAGEKVFAVCKACHQIGETAKNAVGPVLNGIIGRPAGTYPGFNYSDANKNSGLTWDEATFRDYIKDPRAKIPGTKMIYPGLKDEQKASDLLAYLKQFDADGKKK
jgi:cytochrome c